MTMVKNPDDKISVVPSGVVTVLKPLKKPITAIETGMNPATDNEKTGKKITKGIYPVGFV